MDNEETGTTEFNEAPVIVASYLVRVHLRRQLATNLEALTIAELVDALKAPLAALGFTPSVTAERIDI